MSHEEKNMSLTMLAWPIFLEMFLQFLLGATDTLMISHISDDAVGVIGISMQLFNAVNILFAAVASGAGILVAQKFGAKQPGEARVVAMIGLKICMLIGAVLSVLLFFGAGPVARMLQLSTDLQPLGATYISIVGGGMIFMASMVVLSTVIRSTGDTRSPMYIAIAMNIIHVGMNYAFIYGAVGFPQWGLTGVAWSTIISRILGTVMLLWLFQKSFHPRFQWRDIKLFDKKLFRETMQFSWPLGVGMSSWFFTQLVIFTIIASIGAMELTARTYMNTLESFCFLIGFSIALAGQIRISYLHGSGQHQSAYRAAYQALWGGLSLVMANTFLLYLFGHKALSFFTTDTKIVAIGVSLLAINLILQPAKMLNMAIGSALNAVGDTRFNMMVNFTFMWLFAVGFSYALGIGLHWGLYGIYAAMISDELVRGVIVLIRWRRRRFAFGRD